MTNSLDCNINRELDIIDLRHLAIDNDQTWLHSLVRSEQGDLDVESWVDDCHWSDRESVEFKLAVDDALVYLENIECGQKQKFDSRTFTRPKRRSLRPGLQAMVPGLASTLTRARPPHPGAPVIPGLEHSSTGRTPLRHNGTFRISGSELTEHPENDDVLHGNHNGPVGPASYIVSKPININLSEPAHNLHNTFNKILGNTNNRNDSLMNMSPPSLVSSIVMDSSGTFNSATFSRQGSVSSRRSVETKQDTDDILGDDNTAQNSVCSSMTISILDEKEMNTSILSQFPDQDSLPASMVNSMDLGLITSATFGSSSFKRESMESSLINSGTFNTMLESNEEVLPNGRPKFQLRKSFLKPEPDDNFDKFLMLNANCNTDDLRGLSADLLRSNKHSNIENCNNVYRMDNEKENMNSSKNDDSFFLNEGLTDSFLKDTGRESLNITYNKHAPRDPLTRSVQRPQMELEQTVVLPNQIFSPKHQNYKQLENNHTFTRKLNGTYDALQRESPKKNGTYIKVTPSSDIISAVPVESVEIEVVKIPMDEDTDSNKESYATAESGEKDPEFVDEDAKSEPSERRCWTPHRRKEEEGKSMASGSTDSLEQMGSSGGSSPHRPVPLNMHDLETLALEQEQKLYQVNSTPITKPSNLDVGSSTMLFYQDGLSPIKAPTPVRLNSSLGSLHNSPRRLPMVKREASAPEINKPVQQRVLTSPQRTSVYGSDNSLTQPAKGTAQKGPRSPQRTSLYGSDNGLYGVRQGSGSNTNSPSKVSRHNSPPAAPGPLGRLPASKLRQYSSHKELHRIPETHSGPTRWSGAPASGLGALRPALRSGLHASNPVLCPQPLVRQASYTLVSKVGNSNLPARRDFARPSAAADGAPSRVAGAQCSAGGGLAYHQPVRARHNLNSAQQSSSRQSGAGAMNSQSYTKLLARPSTAPQPPPPRPAPTPASSQAALSQRIPRPSGLPRPSSGIPQKRSLRPPSTYSLAPRPGDQASDCY